MKRAVPQDANPMLWSAFNRGTTTEHSRQTFPDANRRVCTSAAMLGLAISVGAYGLVAPQQTDPAIAVEKTGSIDAGSVTSQADSQGFSVSPSDREADPVPDSVPESPAPQTAGVVHPVVHTVQAGQTLLKVAQLYNTDVIKLAAANQLPANVALQTGQVIQIPASEQSSTLAPGIAAASVKPNSEGMTPVLATIPTLEKGSGTPIAVPTLPQLPSLETSAPTKQHSRINTSSLVVASGATSREASGNTATFDAFGSRAPQEQAAANAQVLPSTSQSALGSAWDRYQVNPGDTLRSIAVAHGLSVSELAKANQLKNPNILEVNQILEIPQALAPSVATSTELGVIRTPIAVTTAQSAELPLSPSLKALQPSATPQGNLGMGGPSEPITLARLPQERAGERSLSSRFRQLNHSRSYVRSLLTESSPKTLLTEAAKRNLLSEIAQLQIAQARRSPSAPTRTLSSTLSSSGSASSTRPLLFRSASAPVVSPKTNPFPSLLWKSRGQSDQRPAQLPPKRNLLSVVTPSNQFSAPLGSPDAGQMVSPGMPLPNSPVDNQQPFGTRQLVWPAKGLLTSGYGWRWGRMHRGIDIAAAIGTPVVAAAPGKIVSAGWSSGGYGNLVEIQHPDGRITRYAHNSRLLVSVGQEVQQGERIAAMGSTGYSTGSHSHFEVHLPGRGAVNPIAFLQQQSRGS